MTCSSLSNISRQNISCLSSWPQVFTVSQKMCTLNMTVYSHWPECAYFKYGCVYSVQKVSTLNMAVYRLCPKSDYLKYGCVHSNQKVPTGLSEYHLSLCQNQSIFTMSGFLTCFAGLPDQAPVSLHPLIYIFKWMILDIFLIQFHK